MAGTTWIGGLIVLALVLLGWGVVDTMFFACDRQTISEWLRANPVWFWAPAAVGLLFWGFLGMHLFIE